MYRIPETESVIPKETLGGNTLENRSQTPRRVDRRFYYLKPGGTPKHKATRALLSLGKLKERIVCQLNTQGILAELNKENGDLYLRQKSSSFEYVSRNENGFYYRHKKDKQKYVVIDSQNGTIYAFYSEFYQDKSNDFIRSQKSNYESIFQNATYGKFRYLNFTISFEFSNLDCDLDPNISFDICKGLNSNEFFFI